VSGGFDVIVVLGAALDGAGRLGPALEPRVRAGVAAFLDGRAPRILMTGACEAEAMRARAVELGVPAGAIWTEPTARTTRENALRSTEILCARGWRRALIATQPYHLQRAVAAFRRAGVDAEGLAGVPGPNGVREHAREWLARAVYRARGWI
jgi:uncharacterized SAM-binding protein YcdF (DUF218 family)